jgi:hypothetical protein
VPTRSLPAASAFAEQIARGAQTVPIIGLLLALTHPRQAERVAQTEGVAELVEDLLGLRADLIDTKELADLGGAEKRGKPASAGDRRVDGPGNLAQLDVQIARDDRHAAQHGLEVKEVVVDVERRVGGVPLDRDQCGGESVSDVGQLRVELLRLLDLLRGDDALAAGGA